MAAIARPRGARRGWRPPILLLAICLLAPVLAACGPSSAGPIRVSLLPDTSLRANWDWSARCPLGPYVHGACKASGPVVGVAQLNADEWNLGNGTVGKGTLHMALGSTGGLVVQGDLSSAPPCTQATCIAPSANTWVRAYPNVLYGMNQCHSSTSPPRSRILPLPMRVGAIPHDLIGVTAYSVQRPQVTYDVAYDLWLNRSDTKRPCKTDGTLEVMVWTDYDARALLPASMRVASESIPYEADGQVKDGSQAWSIYVSDVYQNGQTAPWGGAVWVVLDNNDLVSKGTVSVDLSSVLSSVGALLENDYHWSGFSRRYWLDSIPFGMEFGPESASNSGAGSSYFSLKLSSYCLDVGTTLRDSECAGLVDP